jgi:hypothetical protein
MNHKDLPIKDRKVVFKGSKTKEGQKGTKRKAVIP